jgi:hypothetical protein
LGQVAALLLAAQARAQLHLGNVEVEGQAADEAAARADEAVPFVTIVDAKTPSARVASVADLLERQAGVQVRSMPPRWRCSSTACPSTAALPASSICR